jgi:hypothetical protein
MKYAVDQGSGYTAPSFIKTDSGIHSLIRGDSYEGTHPIFRKWANNAPELG